MIQPEDSNQILIFFNAKTGDHWPGNFIHIAILGQR